MHVDVVDGHKIKLAPVPDQSTTPIDSTWVPATPAPFKIGDRVRTLESPACSFVITEVREDYGGPGQHRYWGKDEDGDCHGRYHAQLSLVSYARLRVGL